MVDDRLPAAETIYTLLEETNTHHFYKTHGRLQRKQLCMITEVRMWQCSPVAVVDSISKPRGVNYCEQQLDTTLLYQHFRLLHLRRKKKFNSDKNCASGNKLLPLKKAIKGFAQRGYKSVKSLSMNEGIITGSVLQQKTFSSVQRHVASRWAFSYLFWETSVWGDRCCQSQIWQTELTPEAFKKHKDSRDISTTFLTTSRQKSDKTNFYNHTQ